MENENINKKDGAKEKIILFVIGVLLGAAISTVAFFVYTKTLGTGNNGGGSSQQMQDGGTPPEKPSGENGQNDGTPPEKPDDNGGSQSSEKQ